METSEKAGGASAAQQAVNERGDKHSFAGVRKPGNTKPNRRIEQMAAELDARIAFVKSVASASKSPPIKGLTTNSRLISAASKLPKRHNAEQRTPFFNAIGHPRHFERAPVTSSLHPTSEVSLRCGEPTFRGHLQTHAVEQNPISLDNLVRAGKTVRGVARRRGLTSQQLFTWQRLPVDRSVRAGHIRPGPPRVRHWQFGTRPRPR